MSLSNILVIIPVMFPQNLLSMGFANPHKPRIIQLEEGKDIVWQIYSQGFLSSQFQDIVLIHIICKNCPEFVKMSGFLHTHKGPL